MRLLHVCETPANGPAAHAAARAAQRTAHMPPPRAYSSGWFMCLCEADDQLARCTGAGLASLINHSVYKNLLEVGAGAGAGAGTHCSCSYLAAQSQCR